MWLGPAELARVAWMRPDVLGTMLHMADDFEAETGARLYVPVGGGYRAPGVQARLVADSLNAAGAPTYRVAPAGQSKHEYGAAFDLHIVGGRNDAANPDPRFAVLADIGERYGMIAGYHFRTGLPDPFHFEVNEPLAVVREKWGALVRGRLRGIAFAGGAVVVVALAVQLVRTR